MFPGLGREKTSWMNFKRPQNASTTPQKLRTPHLYADDSQNYLISLNAFRQLHFDIS